jgi:hypothetical protein
MGYPMCLSGYLDPYFDMERYPKRVQDTFWEPRLRQGGDGDGGGGDGGGGEGGGGEGAGGDGGGGEGGGGEGGGGKDGGGESGSIGSRCEYHGVLLSAGDCV